MSALFRKNNLGFFQLKPASRPKGGFTFVEALVGLAIFLLVSTVAFDSYLSLLKLVNLSRHRVAAADLANEQFEIARNLSYSDVGIISGIPSGKIPHTQYLERDNATFRVVTTVRNIDQPFDGTLGETPNDLSPADNKLVEVEVFCEACPNFKPIRLSTWVAPKNLEQDSGNGALFVRVFDANGLPVSGASVLIENNAVSPTIAVDDVAGINGSLQLIDVPPGANVYEVTVSKSGFSTERTISSSLENPNPEKPHATVAAGAVTQLSFAIDKLSSVNFSSVTEFCAPVGDFDFQMTGTKLIGASPNIFKYDQTHTTSLGGALSLSGVEWDTYSFRSVSAGYDLIGINPLNPVIVNPNSGQNVQFVLAPSDPNRLLVTVKDAVTLLPVSEATVELFDGSVYVSKITGQGYLGQTDWSGGSAQDIFSEPSRFWSFDGNLDIDDPSGELKLRQIISGDYEMAGELESSTFDTGSFSTYRMISWSSQSQPAETGLDSVMFQVAARNEGDTWDFIGPDGTFSSFHTVSNQTPHPSLDGNRYFRYKVFLRTADLGFTPSVSDINFVFTSFCTPAGQVNFSGLSSGPYDVTVTKAGYQTTVVPVSLSSSWQEQEVFLNPE